MKKRNIANLITVLRIVLSAAMLFSKPLSAVFFALYSLCGASDMLDGYVARRAKCESETGAKLDSAADVFFAAVCAVKLIPAVHFGNFCAVSAIIIAAVRAAAFIYGTAKFKAFASRHTRLNKITGFCIFAVFFFGGKTYFPYLCAPVCILAFAAAAEEAYLTAKNA